MSRLTKPVLAAAVIAALYIIGVTAGGRDTSARAEGGPTVTVGGPLPLPVSVNNSLTVSLAHGASVLSRELDDPGRIAFQARLQATNCGNSGDCLFSFGPVATGHRIVVQHMAGFFVFTPGAKNVLVGFVLNNSTSPLLTRFPTPAPVQRTSSADAAGFDQPVLFYLDQSQTATLEADVTGSAFFPGETQTIVLTGYELDCNAAPCSPIAQQ